jgi:hypothetical protein
MRSNSPSNELRGFFKRRTGSNAPRQIRHMGAVPSIGSFE